MSVGSEEVRSVAVAIALLAACVLSPGCLVDHEELRGRQCVITADCRSGFVCENGFCNRRNNPKGVLRRFFPTIDDPPVSSLQCQAICDRAGSCGLLERYGITSSQCKAQCSTFSERQSTCIASTADCDRLETDCELALYSESRCGQACAKLDQCGFLEEVDSDRAECEDFCLRRPNLFTLERFECIEDALCTEMLGICDVPRHSARRCEDACANLQRCDALDGLGHDVESCVESCTDPNVLLPTRITACVANTCDHLDCYADDFRCFQQCDVERCPEGTFCDGPFGSPLCNATSIDELANNPLCSDLLACPSGFVCLGLPSAR